MKYAISMPLEPWMPIRKYSLAVEHAAPPRSSLTEAGANHLGWDAFSARMHGERDPLRQPLRHR